MENIKPDNLKIGKLGEEIAKRFLEEKGYKVIEQNYRTRYCEIDLIVLDKRMLVFVEVRTKTGEIFGSPEDTLNKKKIKKIIRGALWYVCRREYSQAYRIDAVCVVLGIDKSVQRIAHYQNITV